METRNAIGERIEDFNHLVKIGSGAFATVYKAKCLSLGYEDTFVAIKKINKEKILKKKWEQRIKNEIKIHPQLQDPSIVKFHTSFEDDKYWYLVLELCEGGTLRDLVKRKKSLSEEEACSLIKQVIEGVLYLKNKQIIHRDLSAKNILLTRNGNVKIADFNLAVECGHDEKKNSVAGTPAFMAPEVSGRRTYGFEVDIWSVGVLLYLLLYGEAAINSQQEFFKAKGKDVGKSVLEFPKDASSEAVDLLKVMLDKDPKKRIDINRILKHAFFQKYGSKKYEYSRRSGDSGLSSQSGSLASSSRSGQKTKGSPDTGGKKHYEINSHSDDQQYGGYFNSKETKSSRRMPMRQNQEDYDLTKPSVPSNINQFKKKIQTLPSRQEIHSMHSYSEDRKFANKDKQKKNIRNVEKENFSQDERFESQFEVPVRKRPHTPSYPSHLQHLYVENLYSNSYSSCNEIGGSKNFESLHYQNNAIKTSSEDNISKVSSCSHDQYCPPENSCLHKSSCCCHRYPKAIHKAVNNASHPESSYKDYKKDEVVKNSNVKEISKSNLSPLNTVRLKPTRIVTNKKDSTFSILNDGNVCVEILTGEKNYLAEVCLISSDGERIKIYKKISPSKEPPPIPVNCKEIPLEKLPKKYWRRYQLAKRLVDINRALTPKVTIYGKDARCIMMENSPNPNYEVTFYNGLQIKEDTNKGEITIKDSNNTEITEGNGQCINFEYLEHVFKNMKERCKIVEALHESLNSVMQVEHFPVTIGRSPLTCLKDGKENKAPISFPSCELNGTNSTIKSCSSGSVNMNYSAGANLSPLMTSSPLNHRKRVESHSKNVSDVLPAMKGHQSMVEKIVEAFHESLSRVPQDEHFPVKIGSKSPLGSLNDGKKNTTPKTNPSSALNGTNSTIKPYNSGSANIDYSAGPNLSPVRTSSPLNHRKRIESHSKNISDELPALKGHRLVAKDRIVADYADGIQMWITLSSLKDTYFLNEDRFCLPGDQYPELMERFHRDLSTILLNAPSKNFERTT